MKRERGWHGNKTRNAGKEYFDFPEFTFIRRLPRFLGVLWLAGLCTLTAAAADATVAPNGDGQFKSIQDAIMAAPQGLPSAERPWVINVKPGIYKELIYVQRERRFIHLVGEDPATTIITFNLHANMIGLEGKPIGTFTACLAGIRSRRITRNGSRSGSRISSTLIRVSISDDGKEGDAKE